MSVAIVLVELVTLEPRGASSSEALGGYALWA